MQAPSHERPLPGRRALLLANRRARRVRASLERASECLKALGFELVKETPRKVAELSHLIHHHRHGVDLVIVAGGDGTLNRTVDALVETELPLGILPLGTANDLARTLGIPPRLEAACQVIAQGNINEIDLGWVNGKLFFNVASIGLSARISNQMDGEVKRRWGVLAYPITALRVMWKSRPFRAEIRSGASVWRVRSSQIAVGNGRYYGGGMTVAKDASIDDRRLDLYSFEVRHWWQLFSLLPALRNGHFEDLPQVRTLHGAEFEIVTRSRRFVNTDGEITTRTPARFRLIPRALSVFIPQVRFGNV